MHLLGQEVQVRVTVRRQLVHAVLRHLRLSVHVCERALLSDALHQVGGASRRPRLHIGGVTS